MRDIEDILNFRYDISPFLAHLTRPVGTFTKKTSPSDVLRKIIDERKLCAGEDPMSDAKWGTSFTALSTAARRDFFGAISLTETPLSEVHCLLEIKHRRVNLAPYGLVFLKDKLVKKGVSPVAYLNNVNANQDHVVQALCTLIVSHPQAARALLPLISSFGEYLKPVGGTHSAGTVDFRWEREWRYPASAGSLVFDEHDVFIGICPHPEIPAFEALFQPVKFIDPRRNMKWYARSLIASRQRLDLKASVV